MLVIEEPLFTPEPATVTAERAGPTSKSQRQIFIAEHGSWNRSEKIGYRITLVSRDEQDDSDIQYLQKDGFRVKRHGGAPLISSSCRMDPCLFQTIRRE